MFEGSPLAALFHVELVCRRSIALWQLSGLALKGPGTVSDRMGHTIKQIPIGRRAAMLCCAGLALLVVALAPAGAKMRRETLTLKTAAAEHVIDIEIAETMEEKSLGLMFRTNIPENTGMLFPYGAPQDITMWMKNTYVSLDMVFIRADGIVHRIAARTEPLSESVISSEGDVSAVLELGAGAAERLGLKAGDLVRHKIFKTAK
jgi:uncharacterized protein